jgi:hypothetical protein
MLSWKTAFACALLCIVALAIDESPVVSEEMNSSTTDAVAVENNGFLTGSNARNFASFFTVVGVDFVGVWSSAATATPFSFFWNNNGKSYFSMSQDDPPNFHFEFYDGQYCDQKTAELTIYFNNLTDYQGNSTWSNPQATFVVALGEDLSTHPSLNCTGYYEVTFVDTNTNAPASNYTNIPHPTEMNVTFTLKGGVPIQPQCNIFLLGSGSADDMGLQSETMKFSMMITAICVIHLYASIQLIKTVVENEPEGKRFSLITLGYLVIWDVYLCLFLLQASLTDYEFFHYFITPAFWYFILASIFETRLVSLIWKIRYQDQFLTPAELRTGVVSFYINFYGVMAIVLVLAYSFIPSFWFLFTSSLFFLPQIFHNAIRGERYKFNSNYIFCLGLVRIAIPLYARSCPANIFELTPSNNFLMWYSSVIAVQVLVLYLQSKFGSRFFIPSFLLPPKFNYYIAMPVPQNCSANDEVLCPICMDNLFQEPSDPNTELLKTPPPVITIMQTPCKHKFHIKCLHEWLRIKLECPFCRTTVPALD